MPSAARALALAGPRRARCGLRPAPAVEPERATARDSGPRDSRCVGARYPEQLGQRDAAADGAEHTARQIRPIEERAFAAEIAAPLQARGGERRKRAAEQDRAGQHRRERHCDLHREEGERRSGKLVVQRRVDAVVSRERERHDQRGGARRELQPPVQPQRPRAAARQAAEQRRADRQPYEVRAQRCRHRVARVAERQPEPAHPDRLVDERRRAGDEREQQQQAGRLARDQLDLPVFPVGRIYHDADRPEPPHNGRLEKPLLSLFASRPTQFIGFDFSFGGRNFP